MTLSEQIKDYKNYCKRHNLKNNDFKSLELYTKPTAKIRELIALINGKISRGTDYKLLKDKLILDNGTDKIVFKITTNQYQELTKRGY